MLKHITFRNQLCLILFMCSIPLSCFTQNSGYPIDDEYEGTLLVYGSNDHYNILKLKYCIAFNTSAIHSFYIGRQEVTCDRYCAFLNLLGCNINYSVNGVKYYYWENYNDNIVIDNDFFVPAAGKEKYPVTCIPEYAAEAYCKFYGYRLPQTEEWRFLASAGSCQIDEQSRYSSYNTIPGTIVNKVFGYDSLCPVASLNPDKFGVYDLVGNVWEIISPSPNYYDTSSRCWKPLSLKKMQIGIYGYYYAVGGSYKSDSETLHYNYLNRIILRYNENDMGFRVAKDYR